MLLAALRQRHGTAADLARVLVGWLAIVLLVQGQAALSTLVRGPAHRHLPPALTVSMTTATQAFEASARPVDQRAADPSHAAAHRAGVAHHHGADAAGIAIPEGGDLALDAAALLLLAALLPLTTSFGWSGRPALGRWPVLACHARAQRAVGPPRRPPRG